MAEPTPAPGTNQAQNQAPTPAPAAAPKAEDIAAALLAALETRQQRSVVKSFSEQYGLSETEITARPKPRKTPKSRRRRRRRSRSSLKSERSAARGVFYTRLYKAGRGQMTPPVPHKSDEV